MRLLRHVEIEIDVKNTAEWSGLNSGLPLAIVGALNLPEIQIQTFFKCQIARKTDPWPVHTWYQSYDC
jgi:hypothetical protein